MLVATAPLLVTVPIDGQETGNAAAERAVGPGRTALAAHGPTWLPPVASAAIPGLGQLIKQESRGGVYVVVEALFLQRHLTALSVGRRERDRYVDLAFTVARRPFTPMHRDTTFTYFEELSQWVASGPFDRDPGPGLLPPDDVTTFNGNIWRLARETFFENPDDPPAPGSPEFARALEFYRNRAVGPGFLWTWEGEEAQLQRYRSALSASDRAFQRGTVELGLLVANHLVSLVDAYVGQLTRARASTEFRFFVAPGTAGADSPALYWSVGISF